MQGTENPGDSGRGRKKGGPFDPLSVLVKIANLNMAQSLGVALADARGWNYTTP